MMMMISNFQNCSFDVVTEDCVCVCVCVCVTSTTIYIATIYCYSVILLFYQRDGLWCLWRQQIITDVEQKFQFRETDN